MHDTLLNSWVPTPREVRTLFLHPQQDTQATPSPEFTFKPQPQPQDPNPNVPTHNHLTPGVNSLSRKSGFLRRPCGEGALEFLRGTHQPVYDVAGDLGFRITKGCMLVYMKLGRGSKVFLRIAETPQRSLGCRSWAENGLQLLKAMHLAQALHTFNAHLRSAWNMLVRI